MKRTAREVVKLWGFVMYPVRGMVDVYVVRYLNHVDTEIEAFSRNEYGVIEWYLRTIKIDI